MYVLNITYEHNGFTNSTDNENDVIIISLEN